MLGFHKGSELNSLSINGERAIDNNFLLDISPTAVTPTPFLIMPCMTKSPLLINWINTGNTCGKY